MHIDGVHTDPSGHHVSVTQSFFLISLGISERGEKGMSWRVFLDTKGEDDPQRGISRPSPPRPPIISRIANRAARERTLSGKKLLIESRKNCLPLAVN